MATAHQQLADYAPFMEILKKKSVGKHKQDISLGLVTARQQEISLHDFKKFAAKTDAGDKLWQGYMIRSSVALRTGDPYDFANYVFDVAYDTFER